MILIIGDSCIDVFRYGVCERLSPEAPVPIFKPHHHVETRGMSHNVFDNVVALGTPAYIMTNFIKPTKTRYVDEVSNQMLLRVDECDTVDPIVPDNLMSVDFTEYDAVIISDYNKGFLSEENIDYISKQHDCVFLDSKRKLGDWCVDIDFIKVNLKEYEQSKVWIYEHFGECWLHGQYNKRLIVTKGKDGASLDFTTEFPIKKKHDVRDLSGAGDTFLAALVVKYLEKRDICDAIRFANICASWVVTQKGVTTIDKIKN